MADQAEVAVATKRRRSGKGLAVGSPVYNELVQFLHEEAGYLDDLEFDAWAELLAEDLVYVAPLRSTRAGRDRHKSIDRTMFHFEDDYHSMMGRIGRLGTKSAWAEDPPSRTRRFVTNIRVAPRSEEHTSELQSLMRISYAVFCLKKKTNINQTRPFS